MNKVYFIALVLGVLAVPHGAFAAPQVTQCDGQAAVLDNNSLLTVSQLHLEVREVTGDKKSYFMTMKQDGAGEASAICSAASDPTVMSCDLGKALGLLKITVKTAKGTGSAVDESFFVISIKETQGKKNLSAADGIFKCKSSDQ